MVEVGPFDVVVYGKNVARIALECNKVLKSSSIVTWLSTPNKRLGGLSPLDFLHKYNTKEGMRDVKDALAGTEAGDFS